MGATSLLWEDIRAEKEAIVGEERPKEEIGEKNDGIVRIETKEK